MKNKIKAYRKKIGMSQETLSKKRQRFAPNN